MMHWHRHYHAWWHRGVISLAVVTGVMVVGTVGMRWIENLPYLEAFYFMSMIATAQGPTFMPATAAGKIFAACMSFVSVGVVVAALGFLFGPFFTHLWHISKKRIEAEERELLGKKKL